jgi:polysaccharide export outer membrane protein
MRHKNLFLSVILLVCLLLLPAIAGAGNYIIGPGDKLMISVWDSPDLSMETPVRPDGQITLPAAGDVKAAGLTTAQLKKKLEKVLAKFVKKPIVTVIVTEMTNNRVYISGGAIVPGVVSLTSNMTLFRFLCQAKNLANADLESAYLSRNGKIILKNFYPLFMEGKLQYDIPLQANDIIHIPTNEMNRVYVVGAVAAPQAVPYHPGMKVLDAILAAGGFNQYAKQSKVTIMRKDGKSLVANIEDLLSGKDIKQNLPVAPGDYVVVNEIFF